MAREFFGWVDDPVAVAKVMAQLPNPLVAAAAPDIMADEDPTEFLFFEVEAKLLGKALPAHDQDGIGTCVDEGYTRNLGQLFLNMIACGESGSLPADLPNDREFVASGCIYGPSRVEIGGGGIRGDGSVGAWAADAARKFGVLFAREYEVNGKKFDLRHWSKERLLEWGRKGMPDDLEPIAREQICKDVSQVSSGEQAWKLNKNGKPTPFCSNRGFTTTRDSRGFCSPKGTWNHCMGSGGGGTAKGNIPFILIEQSWGDSPGGNNKLTLESGREVILPQGIFASELDVIDKMVKQGDTFALAGPKGFTVTRPKWTI